MTRSSLYSVSIAVLLIIGCDEAPTEIALTAAAGRIRATHISSHDNGIVTFNSGSCVVANASTGLVQCSWNVSNGPSSLSVAAIVDYSVGWQCRNPKSGRAGAGGVTGGQVSVLGAQGVTTGESVVNNLSLPAQTLPRNDFTGSSKRANACKGSEELIITGTSIGWWVIQATNEYEGQPEGDFRYACKAVNEPFSLGCVAG